jgi:SPP1 family predicted phage head-tail adaptor
MSAGKYNQRITIKQKGTTTDSYGQEIPTFTTYKTTWAFMQVGQGTEFFAAVRRIPELSGLITIRYDAGILPNMRVIWGNNTYEILAVIQKGQILHLKEELELHVKQILV